MSKYFTVEIIPTYTAATIVSAFTSKDVFFDWMPIQVPKGANKLISVGAVMRGTDGGVQAAKDFDIFFAKSIKGVAPVSLGTVNGTISALSSATGSINKNIIGQATVDNVGDWGLGAFDYLNIAQTGSGAATSHIPAVVLQAEIDSGDNVGYDTLYVGATSGSFNFGSAALTDSTIDVSGEDGVIDDLDGTACNIAFSVGDIIHAYNPVAETSIIMGEIGALDANSITFRFDGGTTLDPTGDYTVPADLAAWKIQNGAGAAGDLEDNAELLNIHPIKIILSFEK